MTTKNQRQTKTKTYAEDGRTYRIEATLRYDGNGHNTFAIIADISEKTIRGWRKYMVGCCHDEIAEHFPEFVPLIKWHSCSSAGPMHYIANTTYHASDKDAWGRGRGEPSHYDHVVYWRGSPFRLNLTSDKAKRLGERIEKYGEHKPEIFKHAGGGHKFTFDKHDKWHECPFDNYNVAQDVQAALQLGHLRATKAATRWSRGKERDLPAARSCAIWPDATDEDLLAPNLKARLEARLPALVAEFEEVMVGLGFKVRP